MASFDESLDEIAKKVSRSIQCLNQALQCGKESYFLQHRSSKDEIIECLTKLKKVKCHLEASSSGNDDISSPSLSPVTVKEVTKIIRKCVPWNNSISAEKMQTIIDLITADLQPHVREILFISLTCCPWYASLFPEISRQARHNTLFVVYIAKDRDFFAPIPTATFNQKFSLNYRSIVVIEIGQFLRGIYDGFPNYIEAIEDQKRFIFESELVENSFLSKTAIRDYFLNEACVKKCLGQAIGGIARKDAYSSIGLKLKPGMEIHEACNSLRLLGHIQWLVSGGPCSQRITEPAYIDLVGDLGLKCLRCITPDQSFHEDFLPNLIEWRDFLQPKVLKLSKTTNTKLLARRLGLLVGYFRQKKEVSKVTFCQGEPQVECLKALLQKLPSLPPQLQTHPERKVLLATRAGSFMYDLHTPSSDEDYILIFAESTDKLISDPFNSQPGIYEKRSPELVVEYGAYELSRLAEMLYKGSVVMLELVFCDSFDYHTEVWRTLMQNKDKFVTENSIAQFMGNARHCRHTLEEGKHKKTPKRESKLVYQMLQKVNVVRSLMTGEAPVIRLKGSERDRIMDIRGKDLSTDHVLREEVVQNALKEVDAVEKALADRKDRNPENVELSFLTSWVMAVRGWMNTS